MLRLQPTAAVGGRMTPPGNSSFGWIEVYIVAESRRARIVWLKSRIDRDLRGSRAGLERVFHITPWGLSCWGGKNTVS